MLGILGLGAIFVQVNEVMNLYYFHPTGYFNIIFVLVALFSPLGNIKTNALYEFSK